MFEEYLKGYSAALAEALRSLDAAAFGEMIGLFVQAYRADKQILVAGNGGSAGTANHFVCDFGKNAVRTKGKRRFRILSLCDNVEKITALGNDIAFEDIFCQQMINLMNEGDLLMVISASGNSPDILKACRCAKERGGRILALTGMGGGRAAQLADVSMVAPLQSYEQVEDVHMVLTHMVVSFFKEHEGCLAQ